MKKEYIVLVITALLLAIAWSSYADSDEHDDDDDHHGWRIGNIFKRQPGVAAVVNASYSEECSSCHFAYQPGLLPARSWKKIMANLDNHFDDNAEVDPAVNKEIEKYLVDNAAESSSHRRSRKVMRSVSASETPMRITKMRYFTHEHNEIPRKVGIGNPKVKSLSNCDACHKKAGQGSYREREINIPGFGRWDD